MARLPKNSLANHSEAARLVPEWHPTKNDNLTPETVSFTTAKKVWWLGKCGHEWDMAVHARTKSGQNCPYCSGKRVLAGFNDLATTHPHLAAQWHPELNTLSLQEVSAGSTKKAWWLGDCKHEWEAVIQSRKRGSGCPYCTNRKVLAGFNDLASRQELAHIVLEWHPENVLKPTEVMPNSNISVKWICSNDSTHEWEAMIANRTRVGSGCPHCYRMGAIPNNRRGETVSESPLFDEWDPENTLNPEEVTVGSGKDVMWICRNNQNHRWLARVVNRTRGAGCPFCSGQRVLTGANDLASYPEYSHLLAEWHPNNTVSPHEISPFTDRIFVNWLCKKGHEWNANIYSRTRLKNGCPICAGRTGINKQMVADFPKLMNQWHPENKEDPATIPHQSTRRFLWKCVTDERHVWEDSAVNRFTKVGCSVCSGRVVIPGVNDLASNPLYAHLLAEWHPDNKVRPSEVTPGSTQRVKWVCSENLAHIWETHVYARTKGNGCPSCAALKRTSKGEDEVRNVLRALGFTVEQSVHGLIPKREIDLYLPEQKVAVEFNGVYWHSEAIRPDPKYHYNKHFACKEAGIRLVQVWEDDWADKRSLVVRLLAHHLGVTSLLSSVLVDEPSYLFEEVDAQVLLPVEVDHAVAAGFFEAHHLKGAFPALPKARFFGLQDSQERLRAAVAVHPSSAPGVLSIGRYASAGVLSDGVEMLLSFIKEYMEVKGWSGIADLGLGEDYWYESRGFQVEDFREPTCFYVVGGKRVHPSSLTKEHYRKDGALLYDETMDVDEHAELNGIGRVWDSGKVVFVKKA